MHPAEHGTNPGSFLVPPRRWFREAERGAELVDGRGEVVDDDAGADEQLEAHPITGRSLWEKRCALMFDPRLRDLAEDVIVPPDGPERTKIWPA
jgi:hypothetical protein